MRAGLPHSEICGSKLVCQLPAAYRKLLRPSSPVIAKASTTCTYSLDPITLHTNPRKQIGRRIKQALPQFSVHIQENRDMLCMQSQPVSKSKKTEYDIFFQIVKEQHFIRRMKRKPPRLPPQLALHTSNTIKHHQNWWR